VRLLDEKNLILITRRESQEEPPNYFIRDLIKDDIKQFTFFPHPTPQLAGIKKQLLRYKRDDGIELTATLYLPAGYSPKDGPLPMVMWAYPHEFKSADTAGQITISPYRFIRIYPSSPLVWLTQGYAVLDKPAMPIVGEKDEEPNDKYVEQLVASAKAAVDEVVKLGVADPDRIAIGGHSYGAFMTANLLAHTDMFRAGIACSGAYNRTLTPFGFQGEERNFWESPQVYSEMSPFNHADKINEPLLLVHGEADNNPGTYPIQSERLYDAIKGLGGTARLVILPCESHSYRARESLLHELWEVNRWLDKYVKSEE
jgi:dipeptidyl aminopeptidase/acylaminoacyl peptidase